jgi:hypothetical protein
MSFFQKLCSQFEEQEIQQQLVLELLELVEIPYRGSMQASVGTLPLCLLIYLTMTNTVEHQELFFLHILLQLDINAARVSDVGLNVSTTLLIKGLKRYYFLLICRHRPAYSSYQNSIIDDITGTAVDTAFPLAIEPLLLNAKVDLAIWGHVHNYERTCAVYQSTCLGNPTNTSGIDTYNNTVYTAPVHAVIGTAGFTLDPISTEPPAWSLVRIGAFGYTYIQADPTSLLVQFVSNSTTGQIDDSFQFTR